MNQNQTPQRTPQRPQGAPNRPPQRPSQQMQRKHGGMLAGLLIGTVSLLVISLIVLCVVLAMGGLDQKPAKNDGDGGGSSNQQSEQTGGASNTTPNTSTQKTKTGITLPSATKAGSYSYSASAAADISGDSQIQSAAASLIDVTNGKAVAVKNGGEKVYPASMTKVMTLLVACENAKDPTALLTLTEEMATKYKNASTTTKDSPSLATNLWKVGVQVTVEDALYMVIYKSDTYACWLLADYVAGSEAGFVQMMNNRASALDLTGTHFENCTGLYHDNHYTTCLDMATIMAAAMNNPVAEKVLTSYNAYTADLYVNGTKSTSVSMYSGWYTGRLEMYPYGEAAAKYAGNGSDIMLVAGKTGYEAIPKYCFVTAGKNDETGTLFVCVQVGGASPKESTDDSREIYQKYANY